MIRSRSMETLNVGVLPKEDIKMAAALLRLTLTDIQEPSQNEPETEFQSYLGTHCQFPYHKAVSISPVRRTKSVSSSHQRRKNQRAGEAEVQRKRVAQRSQSSPSVKVADSQLSSASLVPSTSDTHLSQSAADGNGFFQRFISSFSWGKQKPVKTQADCADKPKSLSSLVSEKSDIEMSLDSTSTAAAEQYQYRQKKRLTISHSHPGGCKVRPQIPGNRRCCIRNVLKETGHSESRVLLSVG